jgi:DNA-directed RNA polymerase subunit E'/Rpb7
MESTAFFEKKINLTPREFNEIKSQTVQELLTKKAVQMMEEKCSEHGFVLPGTIKMLSHSMGHFEAARFTGDAIYYVKLEGRVIYPADGIRVTGEVIRKNKMGLYINHRNAIRIQVPRDLHLGNQEYDGVQIGDQVEVELKRSKFAIQDTYILASGMFLRLHGGEDAESEDESEPYELAPEVEPEVESEAEVESDVEPEVVESDVEPEAEVEEEP